MKLFYKFLAVLLTATFLPMAAIAASPRDLSEKSIFEFPIAPNNLVPATGDYTVFWKNNQRTFYRIDASSFLQPRTYTGTIASGLTSVAITAAGVTATSKCQATQSNVATNAVYIRAAVPTANTVTVTVSADPGASGQNVTVLCSQ